MNRLLPSAALCASALVALIIAGTAGASPVRGRAFGAWLNLPSRGITDQTICDSGWLEPGGAQRTNYTGYTEIPGVLEFYRMDVSTIHDDDCDDVLTGQSTARLETVALFAGQPGEITFSLSSITDDDECCNPGDDDIHVGTIADLTVDGLPVTVTGLPDQTIAVTGGTLVINERLVIADDDCDDDNATHNTLHLYLANGEEVILGSATLDDDDDCCQTGTKPATWGTLKQLYR